MSVYPTLEAAIKGPIADLVVGEWTQFAIGMSATGGYVRGLHAADSIMRDYEGDPLCVVVRNVAPHAHFVDEGHGAFHLPSHIQHWRITKKGKRIVTVPFRHATESAAPTGRMARAVMPDEVHQLAKALQGRPLKGLGDLYKQSKSYVYYRAQGWPGVPEGQGYTWKSSPYEGLRRYGGGTPGGGHQVQYLTFRTITPDSPGWFIPPVAGQHFPERVVAAVGPKIADMVAEALSADLHGRFVAQMNEAGVFTVTRG